MDPIGTISNILSLAERIANFVEDVRGAKEERRRLLFEITALQILLPILLKRIRHTTHSLDKHILATDLEVVLSAPLLQCNIALQKLVTELTPPSGAVQKLLWPFSKRGIADELAQIERLKTYATLALQDGLSAMTEAIHRDLESVDQKMGNIIVNQRRDSNRIDGVSSMTMELKSDFECKERHELAQWISSLCFTEQQCTSLQRRTKGTGTWIFHTPQFRDWMANKFKILWCPGNPGVGKTILTSIVINYLQELADSQDDAIVLFIYCNYKTQLEDAIELLEALLRQLVVHRTPTADTMKILKSHRDEGRRPSLDMITSILVSEFKNYSRAFIVVDALDEIPSPMRSKLLEELRSLTVRSSANLMGTSRNITSVGHEMHADMKLEIQTDEQDLKAHVVARILGDPKLCRLINKEPSIQGEVVSKVVEKAEGMFLLARLHMDALSAQLNRNEILNALDMLPKGFEDTYDEAIKRIDQQSEPSRCLAYRVLSWISYATRPMSLQELQCALVVKEGTTEIDPNDLYDERDLISVCAGLVSVSERSQKLRLVHYTAQQYLERVRDKGDPFLCQDDLSITCLTYLSFNWVGPVSSLVSQHPFLRYAAEAWGVHTRMANGPEVVDYAFKIISCNNLNIAYFGSMMLGGRQRERNPNGLHICSYFGLTTVVQRLLGCVQDIDIDVRDRNGRSPLHWAAGYGNEGVVISLLDTGKVEIDAKDDHDWTPLSWAAGRGHDGVTKILLERGGIEVDARDISGRTSLSWAAERGYDGPLKMLLDTGEVNVNACDEKGRTPLSWAAGYGQVGAVKLLLQTNIDPDVWDNHDWTPLSWAAGRGHDEVVKLLLDSRRVDVNARDEHGRTSLSWAAERGYERSVRLLVGNIGIDVDLPDDKDRTPIIYARGNGHEGIVKLIRDIGKLEVDPEDKSLSRRRTQ